jgi:hypothetical protein
MPLPSQLRAFGERPSGVAIEPYAIDHPLTRAIRAVRVKGVALSSCSGTGAKVNAFRLGDRSSARVRQSAFRL